MPLKLPNTINRTQETLLPPSRWRRVASQLYEAVLLFGVLFLAAYLFDTLTQSRHALMHRHARQAWLFLILGMYFIGFWRFGGQTLAMKTWQIQLISAKHGGQASWQQLIARYLLCWLVAWNGIGWLWSLFDRDRQFLQDRLANTKIITRKLPMKKPNDQTA